MVSRKASDVVQLSKVRMRETLRRKLERDARRNKTTLNAQIVRRIEDSFLDEEKEEYLRKELENRDHVTEADPLKWYIRGEIEKAKARDTAIEIEKAKARDTAILDLLVGKNEASADLLRGVALQLQAKPEWSSSEAGRKELADKIGLLVQEVTKTQGKAAL